MHIVKKLLMPKYEQSIPVPSYDNKRTIAIAHAAMTEIEWKVMFAGEDALLANAKRTIGKPDQVIVKIENGVMQVESKATDGSLLDLWGRNKKNVQSFINSFENCRDNMNEEAIEKNMLAVEELKINTIQVAEQEQKDAEEMNRLMNSSGSNLYVTYTIIAINLLVFVLMVINGAGIFGENSLVHIKWGSNFKPLTLSGDWWRLLTCTFIHFGIIHVAMNMYCLYSAGIFLEPMLGKLRYITAYLCTGVLASLTSLWWHDQPINSAGASGAVFGIYGVFLALLTTNLIPKKVRDGLLKSIGLFVVYNLAFGLKSGIDNAAHIGGLLSGLIIGYAYAYSIKKEQQEIKLQWIVLAIAFLSIVGVFAYLQQHPGNQRERAEVLSELQESSHKDNDKFNNVLIEFDKINKEVSTSLGDTSLNNNFELLVKKIDEEGIPGWDKAEKLIRSTVSFDVSNAAHLKAEKLLKYIGLRKEELNIMKQIVTSENAEGLIPELNENRSKAIQLFKELSGD